jgi:hypothetical protein
MDLVRPEPELLDHLVVEFSDHGRRAVEFLATAEGLLELDPEARAPRRPEAVAYCLREAMKAIPASLKVEGAHLWKTASRAVTEARRRYELARGMPGEDEPGALDDLIAAIDNLELVHSQESIHERRLIAIIVNRTGALPVAAGTAPIRAYQALLVELDNAVHGATTHAEARVFWNRCIGLLRQLFLPPDTRHAELSVLASIEEPDSADVDRLLPLIAGPNHLRYFLTHVTSPAWLEALTETGILDPPTENGPWPAFAAVDRMSEGHATAVSAWLNRMYGRHASDPAKSWFIARAAVDVGSAGAQVVIRVLHDHPLVPNIASLGVWAVEKLDPESELVEAVADVVLNAASWRSTGYVHPVIERLTGGLSEKNAPRRLQLLCWKLGTVDAEEDGRRWFVSDQSGSVADWAHEGPDDRFAVLLRACVDTVRHSTEWMSTDELLAIVDTLPQNLRGRLRAFVLAVGREVDVDRVIAELAKAISERDPTGDDLPLLDRIVAEADPAEYAELWMRQLGPVPAVAEVAGGLSSHQLPEEWLRAYHWAAVLPEQAVAAWSQPASIIAAAYGTPTREALKKRRRVEVGSGRSPMTAQEITAMPPIEAARIISAWRPDPSEWLVGARELARTLEAVVKGSRAAWLESPLRVVTELRHPTYIGHYLRAVAEAVKDTEAPVGDLLDVIALVRAHPWGAEPLGRDNYYDYDPDWRGAEQSSVDVLKALADAEVGFAGRDDEVWTVLESEVRDRTEPSGIVSGARDPLDSAINRRCTRALDAVLSFMAYEHRAADKVRPEALTLLEDCLRLEGTDGAEHRAILTTRLGFLRHIASEWVDGMADLLFGSEAPAELAQLTADLAIKWSRPNRWLLECYRPLVQDAVIRGADHALEHQLIAMLWNVPGYGVEDNITFLRQHPARLSEAGEVLGRLLRHGDAEQEHLFFAIAFWDVAIATNMRDGLAGFGWMAEVEQLDDETWAELTLRTLVVTDGRVDWSQKVAERVATPPASTTSLAIMNHLVRGTSDEWHRRDNIEHAVALLDAAGSLTGTPEYERLRTTLLERGAL